uniref:WD_REPEATS_REGION domain-containing protein n=1 Tax=Haemonchus placei TaxID=6290 RepID=A0A0N4VXQ7_HAEPC
LSWAPLISESHPRGLIFGGTENGTVVFLDAQKLVNDSSLSVVSSRRDHQGHVLSVDYSSDYRWAMSAGSAQLLLWDLTNLATPFSPGTPNFAEQVTHNYVSIPLILILCSQYACSAFCYFFIHLFVGALGVFGAYEVHVREPESLLSIRVQARSRLPLQDWHLTETIREVFLCLSFIEKCLDEYFLSSRMIFFDGFLQIFRTFPGKNYA